MTPLHASELTIEVKIVIKQTDIIDPRVFKISPITNEDLLKPYAETRCVSTKSSKVIMAKYLVPYYRPTGPSAAMLRGGEISQFDRANRPSQKVEKVPQFEDGAAIGAASGAFQPLLDGWDRMVGAESGNQGIGVKLYRVGADIADRQQFVPVFDVGEGCGHFCVSHDGVI